MLGINADPVTIKQVEVEIIDQACDERLGRRRSRRERLTGKKVAVVGSGPAGLAAAQQLTRAGHTVTVYERDDRIGGLLRYGIPEFKMEKRHLDRRLAQMEAEGTEFRAGVDVGVDITADAAAGRVRRGGAGRRRDRVPRDLPVPGPRPGRHPPGDGVPAAGQPGRAGRRRRRHRSPPTGKHVVIIGGGDTGADCLAPRTARARPRCTQLEIMPRPPEARPDAPAVADLPDDLPGLQRARGGRRAGLRGQHRRSSSATTTAGCAALRLVEVELAGGRFVAGRGHRARAPGRPGAARDGLRRPGAGRPARASWASSSTERGNVARDARLRDLGARRVRRRRHGPRPVADRLGDRRGPRPRGRGGRAT